MGSNTEREDDASIAVRVSALTTDPVTGLPVVLLQDDVGRTIVPISIGLGEASALAAEIDSIELARPASHQLMAAMLERCGARVLRAVVTGVDGGTFCAVVHVELPCGTLLVQDARPSDALALALHTGAEIHVATSLADRALQLEAGWDTVGTSEDDLLACLGDDAFGKWKM